MDWDTSIWLSCPIVLLYDIPWNSMVQSHYKLHKTTIFPFFFPLNDIKPPLFPCFPLNDIKPPFFPIFSQCLSSNMAKLRLRMAPAEAIVTRLKLPDDDRLQMTNSLWPAQWSGVERKRKPGNLETKTSENHGRKPWEIYGFFLKGNLIFGKSMFFFFRKPHFFSKSIFFRHGEVKKALLFLEGKHKRGSMIKSFIRFFSSGMWISGYQGLEPSITDGHTLVAFAYFFLLNGAKHRKILVPFWSSIWVPSGKQT